MGHEYIYSRDRREKDVRGCSEPDFLWVRVASVDPLVGIPLASAVITSPV